MINEMTYIVIYTVYYVHGDESRNITHLDSVIKYVYAYLMDILFQINQVVFYIFIIYVNTQETVALAPREKNNFGLLDKRNGKHI